MSIIMSAALMIEPDEAAYLAAWKVKIEHPPSGAKFAVPMPGVVCAVWDL